MQVYAGAYVSTEDVLDGNQPTVRVYDSEQGLVDALLRDVGEPMLGITASSLAELCELFSDYAGDPHDCITYSVTTL